MPKRMLTIEQVPAWWYGAGNKELAVATREQILAMVVFAWEVVNNFRHQRCGNVPKIAIARMFIRWRAMRTPIP